VATVTLDEAQVHLRQLIAELPAGEELVIAQNGEPIAILTRAPRTSWPCKAGSAAGKILFMADDFDAPLEDFKDYME
jgi:antitoxin (DNA-binding transcriptional repressor) of toxin-antitoxin stability system